MLFSEYRNDTNVFDANLCFAGRLRAGGFSGRSRAGHNSGDIPSNPTDENTGFRLLPLHQQVSGRRSRQRSQVVTALKNPAKGLLKNACGNGYGGREFKTVQTVRFLVRPDASKICFRRHQLIRSAEFSSPLPLQNFGRLNKTLRRERSSSVIAFC